jgi:predicted  nucleic acid-binding Zn-ribbon protein
VVTAAPQDQWRLLDVQDHDLKLAQLAHRGRTLPEHTRLGELEQRLRVLGDRVVSARTVAGDVARDLARAEADVDQVRQRAARNTARLDTGQGSPKDLQALQHEIASLAGRQSSLEDVQLEVMERLDEAQSALAEREAEAARVEAEIAEVTRTRDETLAAIETESAGISRARADAAAGLPDDLLALYEKVRRGAGGIGAARLYGRRCLGCRIELTPVDLGRFRAAPPDTVLRCEECGRILVRTPDSGL